MNIKKATVVVGGLSNPSKMPCYGFSTPAWACLIGSKLVNIAGSVCEHCYALGGMYMFPAVKAALNLRLHKLVECKDDEDARERWIQAMSYLLNTRRSKWVPSVASDNRYFRWHDSGDLQGLWHLDIIVEVARRTPDVAYWLPTREVPMVKKWLAQGVSFPSNLQVRLSANMVGEKLPEVEGCSASGVHVTKGNPENGAVECGAVYNDNACGECRLCWTDEPQISYLQHY